MTLLDVIGKVLRSKTYEAMPSTRDRSVREMVLGSHRIYHRFPGKYKSISGREIMSENLSKNNLLLERLKRRT